MPFSTISEDEYHDLADNCLNALTDSLEVLVESYDGPDADNYEAEYSVRLSSIGDLGTATDLASFDQYSLAY